MNTKSPKVSVITITYGHQDYILETIKGVLMQEYDGEIEFIIADDNSPDDTHIIVTEFLKTEPIGPRYEIKYTKHINNRGFMPNLLWALEQATGSYISICEGDDYWIDNNKLKKQVDFLEKNINYNLIAGCNMRLVNGVLNSDKLCMSEGRSYSKYDYFKRRSFHTSTVCYRNSAKLPVWLSDVYPGDKFLFFLVAGEKRIFVSNEIYSVYREHEGGISRATLTKLEKKSRLQSHISGLNNIKDIFLGEDRIWMQTTLNYLVIIEKNMDKKFFQKLMILLIKWPFLLRERSIINPRIILSHFFKIRFARKSLNKLKLIS